MWIIIFKEVRDKMIPSYKETNSSTKLSFQWTSRTSSVSETNDCILKYAETTE